MACYSLTSKNLDIEDFYGNKDDIVKIEIKNNLKQYKEICKNLISFVDGNQGIKDLRTKFQKQINIQQRLFKKYKIKISKMILVYVYSLMLYSDEIEKNEVFEKLIKKCPARNISGVNSFAVLLSPKPEYISSTGEKIIQDFSCKHNCYYCPDETIANGAEDDMPRSYLKKEPAVSRGFRNGWDPIKQMNDRLTSLLKQGHEVDKIELIIEGGTYTEYPEEYLRNFNRDCYYTANTFFDPEPKRNKMDLTFEMLENITSKVKIIGLCIETRPDAITEEWIIFFRNNGVTRVQLGQQHVMNYILKKINRGHTFEQGINAVELLKDNCFKVDIHLMPDLPYSKPLYDKEMFDTIFKTSLMQPDQVKIYPLAVTPYTVVKKWVDSGKVRLYSQDNPRDLEDVIQYAMEICPPHIRLPRVVRDIPTSYISHGNKKTNLRQILDDRMNDKSLEIRSREIGRNPDYNLEDFIINYSRYKSGSGIEYFIECVSEDGKALAGFFRLRIPSIVHNPIFPVLKNKGLGRELHVYDNLIPVGDQNKNSSQHKGIGKRLVHHAEWIAWMNNCNGVAIISGEGVRGYYENKLGYHDEETYMVKNFHLTYKSLKNTIYILITIIFSYGYLWDTIEKLLNYYYN
jgi:ELP3 family radical SAM enzyme/protein acetyltransferase